MKKTRKLLACLLCLIMLFSLVSTAFAADEDEGDAAELIVEEVTETVTEEEPAEVETAALEETEESAEPAEAAEELIEPEAEAEVPEETEAPVDEAEETEEAEEAEEPEETAEEVEEVEEVIWEKSVTLQNGLIVYAKAPESSLPFPAEEITLSAAVIKNSDTVSLIKEFADTNDETVEEVILVDVTLLHNGEEIEPIGPVEISFDMGALIEATDVYHVDEKAELVEDMEADIDLDESKAVFESDHFSTYAIVKSLNKSTVTATVNAVWDETNGKYSKITVTLSLTGNKKSYSLVPEKSTDGGDTWISQVSQKDAVVSSGESKSYTLAFNDEDDADNTMYRIACYEVEVKKGQTTYKEAVYTDNIVFLDLLEHEKEGFKDWLDDTRSVLFPDGEMTVADACAAFNAYKSFEAAYSFKNKEIKATYAGEVENPVYKWEYFNKDTNTWVVFDGETGDTLDVTKYEDIFGKDGTDVRCTLTSDEEILGVAVLKSVLPGDATAAINELLDLEHYTVYVGMYAATEKTVDLRVHYSKDKDKDHLTSFDRFYWGNTPFANGDEFIDHLTEIYNQYDNDADAKAALQAEWDSYFFEIYDPILDTGYIVNHNRTGQTYTSGTYGDENPDFIKDTNSSSFHATSWQEAEIIPLQYNHAEGGVDYEAVFTNLNKYATADAAGDANCEDEETAPNEERDYNVNLSADVKATTSSPVAMILQIQTSWQMFDLMHANAQKGDGTTMVGSASKNTQIATLYDIKQALLRFVDYMDRNYNGNLVLGITETRHDKEEPMFYYGEGGKTGVYVSNDRDTLITGISHWDTFGNCEHVHYTTEQLEAACKNLVNNLEGWEDVDHNPIKYDDIQKVAVILGGATEDSKNKDGWACSLPWTTFQTTGLNSVYGIQCNDGESVNGSPTSWLLYEGGALGGGEKDTGNMKGYADGTGRFNNGTGTTYTELYHAYNEEAVFQTLVAIAESEMKKATMTIESDDVYVENVTVTDTVVDEFVLDTAEPIVATVSDKDGNTVYEIKVTRWNGTSPDIKVNGTLVSGSCEITETENTKTTEISFTSDVCGNNTLTIIENADGTTTVTYNYGDVYNTHSINLNFGIEAKEDYIGSNNVYTNEGTPMITYEHTKKDGTGIYELDAKFTQTPQVNVPVFVPATDGGEKTVKLETKVNLGTDEDLNSAIIVEAFEDLLDNYDQINGTVTYEWTKADGTSLIKYDDVPVVNGEPGTLPDRVYEYVKEILDDEELVLHITFTPEDKLNIPANFHDDELTPVLVNAKTNEGSVWLKTLQDTEIIITKTVEGSTTDKKFDFTATIIQGKDEEGNPTEYVFPAVETKEGEDPAYTIDEDGIAHFSLAGGESVTLKVPMNAQIKIEEGEHNGFYTTVESGDTTVESDVITVVNPTPEAIQVDFTNVAGDALPNSGSLGIAPLYAIATLMLTGSVFIGYVLLRRKREAA